MQDHQKQLYQLSLSHQNMYRFSYFFISLFRAFSLTTYLCFCFALTVWHLYPGGESQLHSDLQHHLTLFREPHIHPQHQCWRPVFAPAFALICSSLRIQHQPEWNPLQPLPQPCTLLCRWAYTWEQPRPSISKPHLDLGEQR